MIKKPGIPKRIVITFEYPDEDDPRAREHEMVLEGEEAAAVEALIFRKENVEALLKGHPDHEKACRDMVSGRCKQGQPQENAVAILAAGKIRTQCSGATH